MEARFFEINADFYDGNSTNRYKVILTQRAGILWIQGLEKTIRIPIEEVTISPRLGNAPCRIQFKNGSSCEVRDVENLYKLLDNIPAYQRRFRLRLNLTHTQGLLCLFATVAILGIYYFWGLPLQAKILADLVPEKLVRQSYGLIIEELDQNLFKPSALSNERQVELTQQFHRLHWPDGTKVQSKIFYRKAPVLGANAIAFPAGEIVITDELIALAADDEEVLAVLSHELGHVYHRHALQQLIQSSIVGAVVGIFLEDLGSVITGISSAILEARYSRDHETQADDFASEIMKYNHLSPEKLGILLMKIEFHQQRLITEEKSKKHPISIPGFLNSHPSTKDRILRLR